MASTERKYDLYGREFRADPYSVFAQMREQDPVLRQPGLDGETPIWFVTRHKDVAAVLLDDERFVRDPRLALTEEELAAQQLPPILQAIDNHMLNRDGDDHRRLRRLVTKAFTPRVVEQLRARIQQIADALIDAVEARGSMDLSGEYAFPLPITVIAELLGVPNADQERFKEWSDAIITPVIGQEAQERFNEQMGEFVTYLTELFAARRAQPEDDLVSALLAARDESDALTEEEVFGTVVLLIVAGHETTVGLIGNAVVNLLAHPEQLERVRADASLLPGAIEEVLRYDVQRDDTRHLAFGRGSHYCLGAPLARLETEIALETLFRRLPGLRLDVAPDELEWRPTPGFRRLVALPVAWPP